MFAEAEDLEAHETRVCIHEGRTLNDGRRERRYSEWQYLLTTRDGRIISRLAGSADQRVEIAKRRNVEVAWNLLLAGLSDPRSVNA